MHVSGGSTCPGGAGHQLCLGLRNAGSLVGASWRGLPTAGGSTWGLSLRGGVFDEQSESSWDAEHAHLHPDNVMLDPDALRELGAFTSEKFRSDEPGGQAKEEIFEWMRTVQEMERANREKGEKKEYIDLSDVEADSEDYRYYDDESNPRRFDKGYGPSRQLDEKMLETRKTYRWLHDRRWIKKQELEMEAEAADRRVFDPRCASAVAIAAREAILPPPSTLTASGEASAV